MLIIACITVLLSLEEILFDPSAKAKAIIIDSVELAKKEMASKYIASSTSLMKTLVDIEEQKNAFLTSQATKKKNTTKEIAERKKLAKRTKRKRSDPTDQKNKTNLVTNGNDKPDQVLKEGVKPDEGQKTVNPEAPLDSDENKEDVNAENLAANDQAGNVGGAVLDTQSKDSQIKETETSGNAVDASKKEEKESEHPSSEQQKQLEPEADITETDGPKQEEPAKMEEVKDVVIKENEVHEQKLEPKPEPELELEPEPEPEPEPELEPEPEPETESKEEIAKIPEDITHKEISKPNIKEQVANEALGKDENRTDTPKDQPISEPEIEKTREEKEVKEGKNDIIDDDKVNIKDEDKSKDIDREKEKEKSDDKEKEKDRENERKESDTIEAKEDSTKISEKEVVDVAKTKEEENKKAETDSKETTGETAKADEETRTAHYYSRDENYTSWQNQNRGYQDYRDQYRCYQQNTPYGKFSKRPVKYYPHKHTTTYLKKTPNPSPVHKADTADQPLKISEMQSEDKSVKQTEEKQTAAYKQTEEEKSPAKTPEKKASIEEDTTSQHDYSATNTPIKAEASKEELGGAPLSKEILKGLAKQETVYNREMTQPNILEIPRKQRTKSIKSEEGRYERKGLGGFMYKIDDPSEEGQAITEYERHMKSREGYLDLGEEGSERSASKGEQEYYRCCNPLGTLDVKLPNPFTIKEEHNEEEDKYDNSMRGWKYQAKDEEINLFEAYKSASSLFGDRSYFSESHPLIGKTAMVSSLSELRGDSTEYVPASKRKPPTSSADKKDAPKGSYYQY